MPSIKGLREYIGKDVEEAVTKLISQYKLGRFTQDLYHQAAIAVWKYPTSNSKLQIKNYVRYKLIDYVRAEMHRPTVKVKEESVWDDIDSSYDDEALETIDLLDFINRMPNKQDAQILIGLLAGWVRLK
jgi:hypothetical protein